MHPDPRVYRRKDTTFFIEQLVSSTHFFLFLDVSFGTGGKDRPFSCPNEKK